MRTRDQIDEAMAYSAEYSESVEMKPLHIQVELLLDIRDQNERIIGLLQQIRDYP